MGKVVTSASVSLDGYIAGPEESGFEHLFAWYDGGEPSSRAPTQRSRSTSPQRTTPTSRSSSIESGCSSSAGTCST